MSRTEPSRPGTARAAAGLVAVLAVLAVLAVVPAAGAADAAPFAPRSGTRVLAPLRHHELVSPLPDWAPRLVALADNGDVLAQLDTLTTVEGPPPPAPRVVVWRDHQPHDLGEGRPVDLDVHGHVVANREGVVVRWDRLGGPPRRLPLPEGATTAEAADMNARGDVAGRVVMTSGDERAVLWPVRGGVVDLGVPAGARHVRVLRLTDDGTVIGNADDAASAGESGGGATPPSVSGTWQWDRRQGTRWLLLTRGRPQDGVLPPAEAVSPSGTYVLFPRMNTLFALWNRRRGVVATVYPEDVVAMSGSVAGVNDSGTVVGCRLDSCWDDDMTMRWDLREGWLESNSGHGCLAAVNNRGDALGTSWYTSEIWIEHGRTSVEMLTSIANDVSVAKINEAGEVAVSTYRADRSGELLVWDRTP